MSDRDRLTVSQEVTLRWAADETAVSSRAVVANVLRERIWLDVPRGEGAVLELEPGHPIRLSLRDVHDTRRDSYWAADVRFVEVIRTRPPRIAVERPFRFVPIQRRAFFRLRIAVPFVLLLTDTGELAPAETGHHAAVVPDPPSPEAGTAASTPAQPAGEAAAAPARSPSTAGSPSPVVAAPHPGAPGAGAAPDGSEPGAPAPDAPEPPAAGPEPGVPGVTEDLSGGGLRFQTDLELTLHQRVELRLGCPPGYWIPIGAEVVRLEPVIRDPRLAGTGNPERRAVALSFVRMHARDQDRVVAYLFAMERRSRHEA